MGSLHCRDYEYLKFTLKGWLPATLDACYSLRWLIVPTAEVVLSEFLISASATDQFRAVQKL